MGVDERVEDVETIATQPGVDEKCDGESVRDSKRPSPTAKTEAGMKVNETGTTQPSGMEGRERRTTQPESERRSASTRWAGRNSHPDGEDAETTDGRPKAPHGATARSPTGQDGQKQRLIAQYRNTPGRARVVKNKASLLAHWEGWCGRGARGLMCFLHQVDDEEPTSTNHGPALGVCARQGKGKRQGWVGSPARPCSLTGPFVPCSQPRNRSGTCAGALHDSGSRGTRTRHNIGMHAVQILSLRSVVVEPAGWSSCPEGETVQVAWHPCSDFSPAIHNLSRHAIRQQRL